MGPENGSEPFFQDELAAGTLVSLLTEHETPPLNLSAVFPTRANLAPKVRVFVDYLVEALQP